MRTTIRIDEALYRLAKARAAEEGQTVGRLIEDALRLVLYSEPELPNELPELPVFGGSGTLPGVDLGDNRALIEAMDAGVGLDALR